MRRFVLVLTLLLGACGVASPTAPVIAPVTGPASDPALATGGFGAVVRAVQPVATQECLRLTDGVNCNFLILVDTRPDAPPNAFQSEDKDGRPVLTFTSSLISDARNAHELAFVMGHEAAHHIAGHLARQRRNAMAGAIVFAGLATLTGASAAGVADAQKLGAAVGARSYSKEFELEADQLGTLITIRAGYSPEIGAQFFTRIPDPGDRFLGTHPPNGARMETVRRTAALIRQAGG